MGKFAPWTEAEAEIAARCEGSVAHEVASSEPKNVYGRVSHHSFLAGVAWAAEQIEKCETIYYRDSDHEERVIVASPECFELDTHEAKLVGVREVEK